MHKILIFTDLHFHPHGGDRERLDETNKALEWIIKTYKENDCEKLLFLGDWSHVPIHTHNLVVDQTIQFLHKIEKEKIPFSVLVGNHDAPHKTKPDQSLSYMNGNFEYTKVLYEPEYITLDNVGMFFVSWYDHETFAKIVSDSKLNNKKNIIFCHSEIIGGKMNNGYQTDHGVSVDIFIPKFDYVFSGHYHTHQIINERIVYVGSLTTTRHGEEGKHGAVILAIDGESIDWKFIENRETPSHLTLESDKITQDFCQGNYVKILAKPNDNVKELVEKAYSLGAKKVTTRMDNQKTVSKKDIIIPESFSALSVFLEYMKKIKGVPEHLDKETLISLGETFINKAEEMAVHD